jgi:hypothetical protein
LTCRREEVKSGDCRGVVADRLFRTNGGRLVDCEAAFFTGLAVGQTVFRSRAAVVGSHRRVPEV